MSFRVLCLLLLMASSLQFVVRVIVPTSNEASSLTTTTSTTSEHREDGATRQLQAPPPPLPKRRSVLRGPSRRVAHLISLSDEEAENHIATFTVPASENVSSQQDDVWLSLEPWLRVLEFPMVVQFATWQAWKQCQGEGVTQLWASSRHAQHMRVPLAKERSSAESQMFYFATAKWQEGRVQCHNAFQVQVHSPPRTNVFRHEQEEESSR